MHTLLNQVLGVPHLVLMLDSTWCTLDVIPTIKIGTPGHVIVLGRCHTLLVETDVRHPADGHPRVQFDHDILHVDWLLLQVVVVVHVEVQERTPLCVEDVCIRVIVLCLACPDAHQLVVVDCEVVVEPADCVGQDQIRLPYFGGWQVDQVYSCPVGWVPGQSRVIPT